MPHCTALGNSISPRGETGTWIVASEAVEIPA